MPATLGAKEAFLVPGLALVRYASLVDYLLAFFTLLCKFVLVAGNADDGITSRNKAFCSDGLFALTAEETLLMPGTTLVLVFAHGSLESLAAGIAPGSKLFIITVRTVDAIILGGERLVR